MLKFYLYLLLFSIFYSFDACYAMEMVQQEKIFTDLPNDVIFLVVSKLSLPDLISFKRVNNTYKELINLNDQTTYKKIFNTMARKIETLSFAAHKKNIGLFYRFLTHDNMMQQIYIANSLYPFFDAPTIDLKSTQYQKDLEVIQTIDNKPENAPNAIIMKILYTMMEIYQEAPKIALYNPDSALFDDFMNYIQSLNDNTNIRSIVSLIFFYNNSINKNRLYKLFTYKGERATLLPFILDCGAHIDAKLFCDFEAYLTYLMVAVKFAQIECIEILLRYNPNLEIEDSNKRTALIHTLYTRNLLNDADQNSINETLIANKLTTLQLLLPQKPNINHQDTTGNTLCHYLAHYMTIAPKISRPLLELIIEYNPDLTIKNHAGKTPIEMMPEIIIAQYPDISNTQNQHTTSKDCNNRPEKSPNNKNDIIDPAQTTKPTNPTTANTQEEVTRTREEKVTTDKPQRSWSNLISSKYVIFCAGIFLCAIIALQQYKHLFFKNLPVVCPS